MGFKCGIVGLPNVGKSTLFNALTKASNAAASNYPFCTIDPNVGVVPVPDSRLDKLASIVNPQRVLPTTIEFVDIAGLVKGASKGEGLGNQFLANIRETDAVAHVVRCFEDENVVHVDGRVSPAEDIDIIHTELALADLASVEKALLKAGKAGKSGDKTALAEKAVFEKVKAHLDEGLSVRLLDLSDEERVILKRLHLITDKSLFYIANVSEDGFENNPYLEEVKKIAEKEKVSVVPICAAMEADLIELSDEEKQSFLQEMGWAHTGLEEVIQVGYQLLELLTFFTAGEKEVRAWTVPSPATAPRAAGVIHTDFEKGFIRAEVVSYADYVEHGGENGAKDAGKWRLEGKDYIVHDGDVMHFRFNV